MKYMRIDTEDVCNGDGLRVVLWISGCSHHCEKCQNPQTWNPDAGVPFDVTAKEELFRKLDKDYISGLTLTGGDPLYDENLSDVFNLITEFRKKYWIKHPFLKTIWLYTGYTWEEIWSKAIEYNSNMDDMILRQKIVSCCNVLVDGRYIDAQRDITLKWRGSANQRVIDIQKSLETLEVKLWTD